MIKMPDWPYPGSRWWKFDFHTHTPASLDATFWQKAAGTANEVTPEKWLLQYMAAGIDCVAVTDHNCGAWIDRLREAYAHMQAIPSNDFRELYIFPGIELSVNGGFHLLVILDIGKTTSDVDTLMGKVDYTDTKGDCDGVTHKSAVEVIQEVLDSGGIPIPAHSEQPKGLLCTNCNALPDSVVKPIQDANTLRQILRHPNILAMERVDRNVTLPGIYAESNAQWAEVVGSDSHSFQGTAVPGSRYTWVKMAKPTLEGLRLALLDGNDISLRRWDDAAFEPFHEPEHFIEKIEVDGAKFMGNGTPETLACSPYFNALIGGRGTGKSTIVHTLRLAYHRESELDGFDEKSEPRHTFEQFNRVPQHRFDRGGLRGNTQITVTLWRDGIHHRLRWRQDGQADSVEEWDGQAWYTSNSQAITSERFPLRLFSQGQIAALAFENRQGLLTVIDEAAQLQGQKQAYEESKKVFFSLRADLRLQESRLTGRAEIHRKLEDVQRKIRNLEQSQYNQALTKFQCARRQCGEVETQFEQFNNLHRRIRTLADEIILVDSSVGTFDQITDTDVLAMLTELHQAGDRAKQKIAAISDELKRLEESAQGDARLRAWRERVAKQDGEYETLKNTLAAQGVEDPEQFATLIQEQQTFQTQIFELDTLETHQKALLERARIQQEAVLAARLEITNARRSFLQIHLSNNPYVRIDVEPFGYDPQTMERSLRDCIDVTDDRFQSDILEMDGEQPENGLIAKLLQDKERLSALDEIKRKLIETPEDLNARFRTHLQRKHQNQPEFADRIHTWFPEDDLRIQYSRRGDGKDFQPIAQGSAGQRAAAILAFLLAFGEEPLVLDQPEDDLDNHLIYDLVVQQIRANKQRRQLVIITHNPNIVVNGDAEMVYAFNFGGGQCFACESGALQEKVVRDEVCRVMEGGLDAFTRRWKRLGKVL